MRTHTCTPSPGLVGLLWLEGADYKISSLIQILNQGHDQNSTVNTDEIDSFHLVERCQIGGWGGGTGALGHRQGDQIQ